MGRSKSTSQHQTSAIDAADISSKYDHINPKSWKGDVRVRNVVLGGSWSAGLRVAETELAEAQFPLPFDDMEHAGGYDIMCPFGNGKMVLVDGHLSADKCNETEDERRNAPEAVEEEFEMLNNHEGGEDIQVDHDLDVITSIVELADSPTTQAPEAWILINDSNPSKAKKVHKASVLRHDVFKPFDHCRLS